MKKDRNNEPPESDPYDYQDSFNYTEEKKKGGFFIKFIIFLTFSVIAYLAYVFISEMFKL